MIKYLKSMFNKLTVNNQVFSDISGSDITINGKKIYVNGVKIHEVSVSEANETVHIKWEGDLAKLSCTSCEVNGNVDGKIDATSVKITGNVTGDVDGTGINIGGDVYGDVDGTSITIKGTLKGNLNV